MSFFIKKIAKNIFEKNKELKNLILVLPNTRLISIFKSEFKNLLFKSNSIWIPNIYTVEEFMEEVAEVFLIDNFSLLLYFYNIFNNYNKDYQSFNFFIKWAPKILSDFDELDMNLINMKDFFSYMISYDNINKWNPNNFFEKININKLNTSIWEILFSCYYELRNKLLKKNHAYQGLIFRIAAKNINNFILKNKFLKKVIFIGLNNLSKSELKIIEDLSLLNKLDIYWDIDKYYYYDENQEAGLLFRHYFKNYSFLQEKIINSISDEFKNSKKIEIIQTSGRYNQIKIIEKLLINLTNKDNGLSKTVIVLPDEYMTIPILHYFYKEFQDLNIELTCFLNSLSLSQSYLLLFRIFCNRQKSKVDNFYRKDILDLFINFHFNTLLKSNNKIPDFLIKNNDPYLSDTIIYNYTIKKNIINIFNPLNKNIKNFLSMLKNSSYLFRINILKKNNNDNYFELIFLNFFDKWINGIESIINKNNNSINNIEALLLIYQFWLKSYKANFFNENNSKLYLMDIIKTNLIDFDNVIILSVNEGILPPEKYNLSWIPLDIRKIFNLSNYQKNDSIYAYYFYHLIQRAKKIFLLYHNHPKLSLYGEKSRFIYQLTYEVNHEIINKKFNISPLLYNTKKEVPVKIYKNFSLLEKLEFLIYKKGISPSSINLYIKNPIEFYIKKILYLNNYKKNIEYFDYQSIGIIVHNIIYHLYKPYINKLLTIKIIKKLKKSLNTIAKKKFQEFKCKNILEFVIIKKYIEKIISWDEKNILLGNKIIINNIEYSISSLLGYSLKKIKLCGIIDRIDSFNGLLRIIDYKTGIIKEKNLNIDSINFQEIVEDSKFDTTLQLLIYIIIWFFSNKETNIIYAGIFSFKKKKNDIISLYIDKTNVITLDKVKNFLPILLDKILELINIQKPFIEKSK